MTDELESGIKKALEDAEDPTLLLAQLAELKEKGKQAKAEEFIDKLLKTYTRKEKPDDAIAVIDLLVSWHPTDRPWKTKIVDRLNECFKDNREVQLMVKCCSWDDVRLKPMENYRRFKTLYDLKEGAYVYERTWGFGKVNALIFQEGKVEVDFVDRPMHQMALSYVAESLELIDEHHLHAQAALYPERFAEMMASDQPEIVRLVLRSYGPKPAPIIQELLVPRFVSDDGWKKFWDAARKGLKADPLVVIPSKRNEPIVLLGKEKAFDDEWFDELGEKRDMEVILADLNEFVLDAASTELSESQKALVIARLSFVVKGAQGSQDDLMVKAMLIGGQLGVLPAETGSDPFVERLFDLKQFLEIVNSLQAKEVKGLFEFLLNLEPEKATHLLSESIPQLPYTALNEAISQLVRHQHEPLVAEAIRRPWSQWEAEGSVMFWLASNMEKVAEWQLGAVHDLVVRVLKNVANDDVNGERLTIRNRLKELFRNPDWLAKVTDQMDERQRRNMAQAIKDSTAWEKLDHGSVMGNLVKVCPELEEIISGKAENAGKKVRRRVCSARTYASRQSRLKRLREKDMPENAKEIDRAREYGDLRENFEYHAAKDHQTKLQQEAGDVGLWLDQVAPADFAGYPFEFAGLGTTVVIRFQDGREVQYHILGEMDSDEGLGIISSDTAMAQALIGMPAGEKVLIPSEEGEVEAELVSVIGLPEAIRQWANDTEAGAAIEA
jgi:transcription elongation GreA/GreB family factor